MQVPAAGSSWFTAPAASQPSGGLGAAKASSAVDDFMAYANMTPAQKMRAEILGNMGMTEDQLNAMSPADRAKMEDKIKELIKQKVEQSTEKKTGVAVDVKV